MAIPHNCKSLPQNPLDQPSVLHNQPQRWQKAFLTITQNSTKSSYSIGGDNQEHRPCLKGPPRRMPAVLVTDFFIDTHYFPWHFLFIFLLLPCTCTPSGIIPLPQSQHYPSSFLGPFLSFILPKGMILVCCRRTHLSTQVPVKILYRPVFLFTVFVLLGAWFLILHPNSK